MPLSAGFFLSWWEPNAEKRHLNPKKPAPRTRNQGAVSQSPCLWSLLCATSRCLQPSLAKVPGVMLTGGNVQPAAWESAVAQSSAYKTVKWLNDQPILFPCGLPRTSLGMYKAAC